MPQRSRYGGALGFRAWVFTPIFADPVWRWPFHQVIISLQVSNPTSFWHET